MIGCFVLVRTRSAGIHVGTLVESSGTAVLLSNSRQVWRWRGANTPNELAQTGADMEHTRISEPVELVLLTEAIGVLKCSHQAMENLSISRWAK